MATYPKTVSEVLADVKYPRLVLAAVRTYAKMRPWAGTRAERLAKMRWLLKGLATALGVAEPRLKAERRGGSCYDRGTATIYLCGRLSVTTLLHEFGHHLLGTDERAVCRWSVNLFRRCFPRQYAKLRHEGHLLRRP